MTRGIWKTKNSPAKTLLKAAGRPLNSIRKSVMTRKRPSLKGRISRVFRPESQQRADAIRHQTNKIKKGLHRVEHEVTGEIEDVGNELGKIRQQIQAFSNDHSQVIRAGALIGIALIMRRVLAMLNETSLYGQTVLITGGTRGLGYMLAKEFARHGCRIAVCGRDEQEVEVVRHDLVERGINAIAMQCDVSDSAQVEYMVEMVTRHFGRIDILVNNAGIVPVGPVQEMTVSDFHNTMESNFYGHVHATLAVLPQMLQRHAGRIVNITSIGGRVSFPHLLPYNAAKFAAVGFSEGLRAELAHSGITVTTIVPGLMRTGAYLNTLFKGQQTQEFTWFSLLNNLPILSIDAGQAARQIVEATRRGDAERVLTVPAQLLSALYRLFPTLTIRILELVNVFLPSWHGGTTMLARGAEVQRDIYSPQLDHLLVLGRAAAEANHEIPGPVETRTNGSD